MATKNGGAKRPSGTPPVTVVPATADRFGDVARVLNPNGREQACWCMHWRAPAKEDATTRGARLRELMGEDPVPGMLAYVGGERASGVEAGQSSPAGPEAGEPPEVAGWLGFSPRSAARSLQRSRVLPVGAPETWSSTWVFMCVTVRAGFRGRGIAQALLDAAGAARRRGPLRRGPRGDGARRVPRRA